jgi:hypothetical protein
MPSIDKRNKEIGIVVDRLEPPKDPMRPRKVKINMGLNASVASEKGTLSPLLASIGVGLYGSNTNSSSDSSTNEHKWDAPGFVESGSSSAADIPAADDSSKSSWKLW